jgi:hypothetical protein
VKVSRSPAGSYAGGRPVIVGFVRNPRKVGAPRDYSS